MSSNTLVQKIWNFCHILRDDNEPASELLVRIRAERVATAATRVRKTARKRKEQA